MGALAVLALIGRLLAIFSMLMLVPLAFALSEHDPAEDAFLLAWVVTLGSGLLLSALVRRFRRELQPRDGFFLVGLIWVVLAVFGALPLMLALPDLSFTDAYFEAMSALTTTGSTVLVGLDELPLSLNVWRCFMQWVGGLGIVVLAVAILPLLGVGGTQLYKAESAGPMKDNKLTPRIADTARALWGVYGLLSLGCFFGYRLAGMSWSDAFMHMCSTVSLGGLSSHDASFGHWNSPQIEAVAIFFMVLCGVNLVLYWQAWRHRSPWALLGNAEALSFYAALAAGTLLVAAYLHAQGTYGDFLLALRHAAFHVASIATTTGYASLDYAQWPIFAPLVLLLLCCFATCAGSTGGGIKMVRMLLLLKQTRRELIRIVHPSAVSPVVLGGQAVSERVMGSVIAFMMMYGATIVVFTMLLVFSGMELVPAFTGVIASINNTGPGLGDIGPAGNYQGLSDFQTWVCTLAMLLGRLELLSVLVLLTPQFWRK